MLNLVYSAPSKKSKHKNWSGNATLLEDGGNFSLYPQNLFSSVQVQTLWLVFLLLILGSGNVRLTHVAFLVTPWEKLFPFQVLLRVMFLIKMLTIQIVTMVTLFVLLAIRRDLVLGPLNLLLAPNQFTSQTSSSRARRAVCQCMYGKEIRCWQDS